MSELEKDLWVFLIAILVVYALFTLLLFCMCELNYPVESYDDIESLEIEQSEAEQRIKKIEIHIRYLQELNKLIESEE